LENEKLSKELDLINKDLVIKKHKKNNSFSNEQIDKKFEGIFDKR